MDLSGEWRKSSHSSGGNNSACVEVMYAGRVVGVRDSKNRGAGVLVFSAVQWRRFLKFTES